MVGGRIGRVGQLAVQNVCTTAPEAVSAPHQRRAGVTVGAATWMAPTALAACVEVNKLPFKTFSYFNLFGRDRSLLILQSPRYK